MKFAEELEYEAKSKVEEKYYLHQSSSKLSGYRNCTDICINSKSENVVKRKEAKMWKD